MVRIALDALFEAHGRLPVGLFARHTNVPASRVRSAVAGLQRLLNVDGYPVLRFSDDMEHIELDSGLLVERFQPMR